MLVQHESDLTPELLSPFLSGPNRVEAIFTLQLGFALCVFARAQRSEKEDIDGLPLVSFDDFELAEMIPPGLTVVRQPAHELGHQAAKYYSSECRRLKEQPAAEDRPCTEFIVRGSCGCKPKAWE